VSLHHQSLQPQPPRVGILGPRLDMQHLPTNGHPLKIIMMAFSSRNGAASLPSGPSSGSVLLVRDPEVMKLRIMPQSLSLCLTG
jgi:hypothetical protein